MREPLPELPPMPAQTRTVHHMRVMDAAGRPMTMAFSQTIMDKLKVESERAKVLAAMPWYRRWPRIAARRAGYWLGRVVAKWIKRK